MKFSVVSLCCSFLALRDAVYGFVVCILPFVLGHEVLFVVLSWSSGRQLWLFVFVVLGRFVVHGL